MRCKCQIALYARFIKAVSCKIVAVFSARGVVKRRAMSLAKPHSADISLATLPGTVCRR